MDRHLHAYINLAGPLLGLPKALSPLLSGACAFVCSVSCVADGTVRTALPRLCMRCKAGLPLLLNLSAWHPPPGETRETVDMMAGLAVLVEQYLGKQTRAAVSRVAGLL